MKNIFIIFTLLFSTIVYATIDERKSDVYFANGIDTTEKQAERAIQKLKTQTKKLYPEAYKQIKDWKVSYNETHGFQQDIYESAIQKVFTQLDDKHSGYQYGGATVWIIDTVMKFPALKDLLKGALYFGGRTFVKDQLKNHLIDETKTALAKRGLILSKEDILFLADVVFDELLDNLLANPLDDTLDDINQDVVNQATAYANSIKQGHGVIVVAHSQGNFFTNFTVEKKMQQWTQKYFHVIGVATPTSSIANGGPYLTFHNDVIQAVPGHLGWNVTNPISYYRTNAVGETVETFVSVEAHNFLSSYMATSITRNEILGFIDSAVMEHKSAPSQYKIKSENRNTNICEERRASLVHFEGAVDPINDVYPFNHGGKVFEVMDANFTDHYVLGSVEGTRILDVQNPQNPTDRHCYELQDTSDKILKSGCDMSTIIPKAGVVTVSLNWDDPEIDLDLDVGWNAGTYDIKDVKCPTEHFFIESAYSINPGRYPVRVNSTKDVNESLLPEIIQININVPGQYESYTLDINTSNELDIGHVADIKVEYIDDKPMLTPVATLSSASFSNHTSSTTSSTIGGSSGSGGRVVTSSSSNTYSSGGTPVNGCYESCGCIPCAYEIIPYLEQALLGPLSGADVELHIASQYGVSGPIYSGVTSSGNTLYTAGIIDLDEDLKATLDDNELYIFTVSGGKDIDANDDFNIDTFPTLNRGQIHAVLTGEEIKEIGFKVNVLSEISYQITKDMYGGAESNEIILGKLDEVATLLLKDKIYTDSSTPLGHTDLLVWLPTIDQELLFVDYASSIQPIIDEIYYDNDIYTAAYNVVYLPNGIAVGTPRLQSSILRINEHSVGGTHIGKVSVFDEGDSEITTMTMNGDGVENFILNSNGSIIVSPNADLDFEKKEMYKFSVSATNSHGKSAPITLYIQLNNLVDVPVATSFAGNRVFDNADQGDTVGVITFNQGASPITSLSLLGEGSQYFDIDVQGNITVGTNGFTLLNETQSDYREKTTFSLTVIAENNLGRSVPVPLALEIYHVRATPTLMDLSASIDESATASTVVDTIKFNEGASEVLGFTLGGSGSENFIVDNFGVIRLNDTASLDYEVINSYNFLVSAYNQTGTSETANIYIRVNNSLDVPELKSDIAFRVDENATVGIVIGNVLKSEGGSAVTKITLQNHTGSYNINDIFEAELNGNIKVKSDGILDYESIRQYYFTLIAENIDGESIRHGYRVYVNNSHDVPELKNFQGNIYENVPAGTFIGNILTHPGSSDITSFTLNGTGSENFEIGLNGDITVSATANLNYEDLIYYYLNATATNAEGSKTQSVTIKLTDILDVPLLKSFSGSVDENSVAGSVVGQVEITQGASSTISTSLSGSGSENFTIDINGTIRIAVGVSIDYEKAQGYSFYVTATNTQGSSLAAYVKITVNDMLDVPNVQSFSAYVDENAAAGTILGSVNFNEGASPITALEFSGAGSELFDIDLTGLVTVSADATFDYDHGVRAYHFSITATNALGESSPQSIFIYVNNILDVPQISNFSADVNENVPIGTQVGRLNINEGLSPLLSIDLSRSGSELFSVDINGTIRTVGNFDYDVEDYYVLSVTATNSHGTSVASRVAIRINDIASYPKIEDFTADINENSSASTHIGKLELINGIVPITSFNIYGTGSELFNIDVDGNIFSKKNTLLDYERQSFYSFTVVGSRNLRVEGTAYEIVTQRFYAKIEINVSDIIDVAVLKEFSASVTENSGKGIIVGNVEIISNGDTPVRSMTLTGIGSDEFVIDVDGLISLRNDLGFDYERQQDYNMSVTAHTDNGDSEVQTVNITVKNLLEAPTYLDFNGEISEDSDSGIIVGQISSLPLKETTPTSIQLSGEGSEHFSADTAGVIRIADVQLDFETKNFYTLKAKASTQYGDSNEVSVTIEIIDVDEYAEAGLGRWGDATVNIYKIEDNATQTLKFSEITSIGSDVNSTGVFNSHRLELEQNSFYIYEVSGGDDYDANNDGILDEIPTPNNGTIHAVVKGNWVRHINWRPRVNMMSEVYYQHALKNIDDLEAFENKLLYPNGNINKDLDENFSANAIDALVYNPVSNIGTWNSYTFPERSLEYIKQQIYENDPSYTLFISNSFMYPSYTNNGDVVLTNEKNKIFSVDYDNGLRLIDISDLNNPVITNIMSESMELITISTDNQHLFIKSYERGDDLLRIVDISDILNPTVVSSTGVPKFNNMKLSKDEKKLYISILDDYNTDINTNANGLGVIDISDITQPIVGMQITTPGQVTDLILSKDEQTVYMTDSRGGLQVIDISDPNEFKLLGTYITEGLVEKVLLSNDEAKVYLTIKRSTDDQYRQAGYMQVVDITDKSNPILFAEHNLESSPLIAFIFNSDETKMFTSSYYNGQKNKIYENVGYFQDMNLIAEMVDYNDYDANKLFLIQNETVMLSISFWYITIIDISDPTSPTVIKTVELNFAGEGG